MSSPGTPSPPSTAHRYFDGRTKKLIVVVQIAVLVEVLARLALPCRRAIGACGANASRARAPHVRDEISALIVLLAACATLSSSSHLLAPRKWCCSLLNTSAP